MTYNDKTYCASPSCQNACGRKMSADDKAKLGLNDQVCYAFFCYENVEAPGEEL